MKTTHKNKGRDERQFLEKTMRDSLLESQKNATSRAEHNMIVYKMLIREHGLYSSKALEYKGYLQDSLNEIKRIALSCMCDHRVDVKRTFMSCRKCNMSWSIPLKHRW